MYPVTVLLNVLGQLLVFMSDLAVLLFSIALIDSPRGGKKEEGPIFFCVYFLILDRNWWIFSHTLGLRKIDLGLSATIPCV